VLDITTRAYDTYGRLVGVPSDGQSETRAELDAIQSELIAYYDESFDVSRTRTGAFVRREKRKAIRRVRREMQDDSAGPAGLTTLGRRVAGKVRGRFRGESA
jgi:hypothetical protein